MRVEVQIVREHEEPERVMEGLSEETQKLIDNDYCVSFPMKFEVCLLCNGSGSHVDPGIDSHGITEEEWDRDWSHEDRENYHSGLYNVTCYECGGANVVPEIDKDFMSKPLKELLEFLNKRRQFEADDAKEHRREIEMEY
jgi:hypothetical protein